jgi:ankyrin repeat protein
MQDLHIAAYAGDLTAVMQLVQLKGCSVTAVDCFKGSSALHWASRGGSLEVVKWLIKAGSDPNGCNHDGRSPVYFAADGCHAEVVEYLASSCGAQVNAHDRVDGQTPLHRYALYSISY